MSGEIFTQQSLRQTRKEQMEILIENRAWNRRSGGWKKGCGK
jgi:hypothetical protein